MDNKSDSDESYDKVSWDEFCISASDGELEANAKDENLVSHEIDGSDADKLSDEQKKDNIEIEDSEHFSENSSYDDDNSSGGDSDGNIESLDPEDDDAIDMIELENEPRAVPVNYKRKVALAPLAVPGIFDNPNNIKRREDMEIRDIVKDHALLFLPAKSLARFKAVSKEWEQWISGPFFAHKQTAVYKNLSGFFCQASHFETPSYIPVDRPSSGIPDSSLMFLPEVVVIRSSCFGLLLCQALRKDNSYYVCNPVNKEYRKIPEPKFYHGLDPAIVLAFEPSDLNFLAHFQIICAFPVLDQPIVYFEIYSSATNEWRCSATECIELEDSTILGGGYYIDKIAYFVTDSGCVLAFDMKSEVCGVLSLPTECEWDGVLTRMDGELCYVHTSHLGGDEFELRVYGGMEMSFKKNVSLNLHNLWDGHSSVCRILPFVAGNGNDVAILAGKVVWLHSLSKDKGCIIGQSKSSEVKYLPFVSSLLHLPPE